MENEISDRTLEVFYRLLRGEAVSNKAVAEKYGISSRTVSRDIGRIQNFLSDNRGLMQNAEVIYSHKEKAYVLKSDEFLKNQELFALAKIVLGSRSLNKEELLTILSKLKKFTTPEDRQSLENIIRKEVYHYHPVRSDCESVISNLWRLIQCIENKSSISVSYIKMDRSEVIRKLIPSAIMFSEYYFYLVAYDVETENHIAKHFRIDRIKSITEHREKIQLDKKYDFDEGELREKNQFMFPGEVMKITFEFTGLSVQAILDRLPTAKVIEKNGNKSIITAEVNYGRGIIMYLLSQGSWVRVISPEVLIDDIREEADKITKNYH